MKALEKISIAILLAKVRYIIAINDLLSRKDSIEPSARWIITFLTRVGLSRLLFVLIFWVIKRSDTLLVIYRRDRFLKGVWTYRYEIGGQAHLGIWRIGQDPSSISVTGYGIDQVRQGRKPLPRHKSNVRGASLGCGHVLSHRQRKRRRSLRKNHT
ncbi:MAG: hypothetical protein JXR14_01000 [Paracoccaceae bacterium]